MIPRTLPAGFYVYDAKRKATPDPEGIAGFLEASRAAAAHKFPTNVSKGRARC